MLPLTPEEIFHGDVLTVFFADGSMKIRFGEMLQFENHKPTGNWDRFLGISDFIDQENQAVKGDAKMTDVELDAAIADKIARYQKWMDGELLNSEKEGTLLDLFLGLVDLKVEAAARKKFPSANGVDKVNPDPIARLEEWVAADPDFRNYSLSHGNASLTIFDKNNREPRRLSAQAHTMREAIVKVLEEFNGERRPQ